MNHSLFLMAPYIPQYCSETDKNVLYKVSMFITSPTGLLQQVSEQGSWRVDRTHKHTLHMHTHR